MSEKRFKQFGLWIIDDPNSNVNSIADLIDTKLMSTNEVVDLLNELFDENEQLKKENEQLREKNKQIGYLKRDLFILINLIRDTPMEFNCDFEKIVERWE